jgi:hypothetical protein
MIVHLTTDRAPEIRDVDRFDRLSVRTDGPLPSMRLAPTCRIADDDHLWIAIDALRAAAAPADAASFEAMVGYAVSKRWVDETGTHLRAHVESALPD